MHAAMATPAEVYKKGFLYKRQRGRRSKDLQKLKFQRRFCQLTTTAFEYYKGRRTVITHRVSNPGFAFDIAPDIYCIAGMLNLGDRTRGFEASVIKLCMRSQ